MSNDYVNIPQDHSVKQASVKIWSYSRTLKSFGEKSSTIKDKNTYSVTRFCVKEIIYIYIDFLNLLLLLFDLNFMNEKR